MTPEELRRQREIEDLLGEEVARLAARLQELVRDREDGEDWLREARRRRPMTSDFDLREMKREGTL